jgi:hypothetical protein
MAGHLGSPLKAATAEDRAVHGDRSAQREVMGRIAGGALA